MTFPFDPVNTYGDFIPQNLEWPQDPDELLYELKRRYRRIGNNLGYREIANYLAYTPDVNNVDTSIEALTGQQWFVLPDTPPPGSQYYQTENRTTFRKIVRFPTALVVGVNTQTHNIAVGNPTTFFFTKLYGVIGRQGAPNPLFLPVPNDDIHMEVSDTTVSITIPAAYAGFFALTILEYLKF